MRNIRQAATHDEVVRTPTKTRTPMKTKAADIEAVGTLFRELGVRAENDRSSLTRTADTHLTWSCGRPGPETVRADILRGQQL